MRGFQKISSQQDNENVQLPKRNTKHAAAYDFVSPIQITLKANQVTKIPSGIKSYFQADEVLYLFVRSSMGIKRGITLANQVGVVDSDYYDNEGNEGEIIFALRNNTEKDIVVEQGERIAQGIFQKILLADDDNVSNETRTGGIGSTGK